MGGGLGSEHWPRSLPPASHPRLRKSLPLLRPLPTSPVEAGAPLWPLELEPKGGGEKVVEGVCTEVPCLWGGQEELWGRNVKGPSFAVLQAGCFMYFVSHAIHKGPVKEMSLFLFQKSECEGRVELENY